MYVHSDGCSGTQHIQLGVFSVAKQCHIQVDKDDTKKLIWPHNLGQPQNEEDVIKDDLRHSRQPQTRRQPHIEDDLNIKRI